MKFDINLITDWRFLIPTSVAIFSIACSVFNFIVGKLVASKIMGNDLKHITADIKELKKEKDEIKIDLKQDLGKIFNKLSDIKEGLAVRKAICELRHKNDKK